MLLFRQPIGYIAVCVSPKWADVQEIVHSVRTEIQSQLDRYKRDPDDPLCCPEVLVGLQRPIDLDIGVQLMGIDTGRPGLSYRIVLNTNTFEKGTEDEYRAEIFGHLHHPHNYGDLPVTLLAFQRDNDPQVQYVLDQAARLPYVTTRRFDWELGVEDAIRRTVEVYGGLGYMPDRINNGLCEDFAVAVSRRLTDPWTMLDSDNFTTPHRTKVDWVLVDEHWGGKALTPERRERIEYLIRLGHRWLLVNGRHYDATAPEGVEHFFDLPFFAR